MYKKLTLLACALVALAGCASDSTPLGNAGGNTGGNTGSNSSNSSSAGGSGSVSSTGSGGMASTTAAGSPGMQSTSTGGVVQSIEQITRQDAMALGLSTAAAASGGTMGSPTEKIYRVTVRLDDGSTQIVLAESMPSYKNGERVRYANGIVTRE